MPDDEARLLREMEDLGVRHKALDNEIVATLNRQRYSAQPGAAEEAIAEEKRLRMELDRLMTRMRAVEGKLMQVRKRH